MHSLKCSISNIYEVTVNSEKLINSSLLSTDEVNDAKWIIPNYQRLYKWEKGDFSNFIGTLSQVVDDPQKEIYFGQLIMCLNDEKNFEVVDGQQRLTTFMILAQVILENEKVVKISEVNCNKLKKFVYLDDGISRRFCHQKMNEKYISEYIYLNEPSQSENHADILEAYREYKKDNNKKKYRETLKKLYSSRKTKDRKEHYHSVVTAFNQLENWYSKELDKMQTIPLLIGLINKVSVSHLISTEFQLAYESFLSLNSQGRSLTNYDLIKSIFVGAVSETTGEDTIWEKHIDTKDISESKVVDMLDVMLRIKYNDEYIDVANKNGEIKKNNLHVLLKNIVTKNNSKEYIETLFKTFVNYVDMYIKLKEGSFSSVVRKDCLARYNGSVKSLLAMKYVPFLPILFEVIDSGKFEDSDMLDEILLLAKYAPFIYVTVCGQKPDFLTKLTSQYISKVIENPEVNRNEVLRDMKKEFSENLPKIDFVEELATSTQLSNAISKDVLMLLEPHLTDNDSYDNHLEHIYPQKAKKKNWPQFEGDRSYIGLVGNHILLPSTLNKSLGNKSYEDKMKIMQDEKNALHKFKNATDFLNESTCHGPKEVLDRGRIYAEKLKEVFVDMELLNKE